MPIGDLLAEISGGPGDTLPVPKPSAGVKRKVDDDSRSGGNKIVKARHSEGGSASHIVRNANGRILDQSRTAPREAPRPGNSASATKPPARKPSPTRANTTSTAGRSSVGAGLNASRPTTNGRPTQTGYSGTAGKRPSDAPNRPKPSYSAVASTKPPAPKPSSSAAPPKKGSFAEIMARGQKAQESKGKVGVIQHKAINKPLSKKDREAVQAEQKVASKAKPVKTGYTGSGRPGAQTAREKPSLADIKDSKAKGGAKGRPGSSGGDQEKKVKKSAMATTGYSGTARPRPGATSNKPASNGKSRPPAGRAGGLLAPPKISRRNDYEDDYDEDMDDFIDYDDEEEEQMVEVPRFGRGPPRYNYVSEDDESDMEAGMSDIDGEESRAEKLARAEDKREQALEEKLKREKEARKRQFSRG